MLSLSLDCDYVREDVPSVKEETPSLAFMELDSDGSVPSVSVFLLSSVLVMTTFARGTSMWMFAEPSAFGFEPNLFLTKLPFIYQPDKECKVRMRLSPTLCEEKIPNASIASKS